MLYVNVREADTIGKEREGYHEESKAMPLEQAIEVENKEARESTASFRPHSPIVSLSFLCHTNSS